MPPPPISSLRRGGKLREHILWTAKDVFLEVGFDRASMDEIAARAQTSKRTLYAHFGNKESLFVAVAELTRGLYLDRLGAPEDYAQDSEEAIVLFCGRFLEVLLWESASRTCRLGITEAERLPAAGASYYDTLFATTHDRLADFLAARHRLEREQADRLADALIGRMLYPRVIRVLFGVDPARPKLSDGPAMPDDLDLTTVRTTVSELLELARA
ncbi:MAG: TetR/AcrR family transcriptional regulator [Solirubrobacteraceae bacterium]